MKEQHACITGIVLDEQSLCSFTELCRLCNVNGELIEHMIDEGIITPQGCSPKDWQFSFVTVNRVQTVVRLQQDLRVNLPGCALVLDLLDELHALRQMTRRR